MTTATLPHDRTPTAAPPPVTPGTPTAVDPPARSPRRRRRLAIVGGVIVGALAAAVVAWSLRPHLYSGTVLQGDDPAPALDGLFDVDGKPFDPASFDGKVTMLYFGYLGCPDVCPTTLLLAAEARAQLAPEVRDKVQLVMVTVDPDRDSSEALDAYVTAFDPDFVGLRGSPVAVADVATRYGVYFSAQPPDDDGWYAVDHTATVMGIAPQGSLRIVWLPNVTPEALAADLAELAG